MKTITNNSLVQITYVSGKAKQIKRMVPISDYEVVEANRNVYEFLTSKQQKEFVKTNKIRLDSDEVAEHSPMGLAIMGLSEGETGIMILPSHQGGEHVVKILKIYESEEANSTS